MASALCYTFDLSIGQFARPKFTTNFIHALYKLNDVVSASDQEKMEVYKMFLEEFGTHFVKSAEFGASLNYQVGNYFLQLTFSPRRRDLKTDEGILLYCVELMSVKSDRTRDDWPKFLDPKANLWPFYSIPQCHGRDQSNLHIIFSVCLLQSMFTSRTMSKSQSNKRNECSTEATDKCLSAGFGYLECQEA